jgi:hypothetical protein
MGSSGLLCTRLSEFNTHFWYYSIQSKVPARERREQKKNRLRKLERFVVLAPGKRRGHSKRSSHKGPILPMAEADVDPPAMRDRIATSSWKNCTVLRKDREDATFLTMRSSNKASDDPWKCAG